MTPNDVLRSLRFLLDADDARMAEVLALGGGDAGADVLRAMLTEARHPDHIPADDRTLAQLLDGIVVSRRGPSDTRTADGPVTNNTVLKKLRIAYQLQDDDMFALLAAGGSPVSKPELSSWFRGAQNPHFRPCSDAHLRAFLTALAQRLRKKSAG